MATLKTVPTDQSVNEFIDAVEDEQRRDDCRAVRRIMEEITGEPAKMWSSSIVGFGNYHYQYASGHEGDWMITGFSPRKRDLTLYLMAGFERYDELMEQLGKYKNGKSCLYIKRLADIDEQVLRQLITASVSYIRERYG